MRWKRFALWIMAVLATGQLAVAAGPTSSPMFRHWIVNRMKLSLVGGRVVCNNNNGVWMFGMNPKQVSSDGQIREQISLNGNGIGTGSLAYTYRRGGLKPDQPNDSKEEFGLDLSSDGRFVLRYADKDQPASSFELTQVPGQPVSLSVPGKDKPRVLRAPSIWHLLIIDDEDCRREFLPMLESIRPDWHVGRTARAAEDELVKLSAVSQKSDRKQWETWVSQLGDSHFAVRSRADRNLRDVGPALVGYLNRLDMNQLDVEQKSRIRRIIRDLSAQNGEDTAEHIASMLIEDPLVWLALLSRPEESTRRAAVQQLTALLNIPIAIDPKAEPETQAKARDELRAQIEKKIGVSSKPDDAPKATGGNGKS